MPTPESLKSYAQRLGYPDSQVLGQILTQLFDSDEKLRIAAALPGTIDDIASKAGMAPDAVQKEIRKLHLTGAVNQKMHGGNKFRLYPGIIELRDAVVASPDAPEEMLRLWDHMIQKELPQTVPLLKKSGIPPMMRVIPIEETVDSKSTVLDADSARSIIKTADQISAIPCVCRKAAQAAGRGKECQPPEGINLCFQINAFADDPLSRGVGEKLTKEEALRRLDLAEKAGLVHLTRNNIKEDMILCNCCSCCCTGMYMLNQIGYDSFAPSRFQVKLDVDECIGCETCEERCHFSAITMDDTARIDPDKCFGCGVCVPTCPVDALTLEEVRPKEFIRNT